MLCDGGRMIVVFDGVGVSVRLSVRSESRILRMFPVLVPK